MSGLSAAHSLPSGATPLHVPGTPVTADRQAGTAKTVGQAAQEIAGADVDAVVEGPACVLTDGGRAEVVGYARGVLRRQIRQVERRAQGASEGSQCVRFEQEHG